MPWTTGGWFAGAHRLVSSGRAYDGPVAETPPPVGADLFDADRIRLERVEAPRLSPEDEVARDRAWDEAVRANPALFDGPVVACAGLAWEEPRSPVLFWTGVTYRHYALRRVPGSTSLLPSLSVAVVQPTVDGRVLVGRMSSSTSVPGQWQFPGGSVEPPGEHEALDEAAVRRHAARELAEETGIGLPPEELRLCAVTRGVYRNVGVVFLAPPRPAGALRECFAAVTAAEREAGRDPELDRISFVSSPAELADLGGPHVDYLEPVVRRCTKAPNGT